MTRTTRRSFLAAACGLALAWPAAADDAKKPAPAGRWHKTEGQIRIDFLDKGVMKIAPHGDDTFVVVCSYAVTKDGRIKAKITELEGKDEIKEKAKSHLPVGMEWTFAWNAKGEKATLDNIDGKEVDLLKSHLEGEFKKRTD